MEKRISFIQFQSVKSVAKAIDPHLRNKARVESQMNELDALYKAKEEEAIQKAKEKVQAAKEAEAKNLKILLENENYHISALESGIVTILGFHVTDLVKKVIETEPSGKKTTKYVPTSMVSYDEKAKQFVVTMPDMPQAGSDFDVDANMPFAPQQESVAF